MIWNGAMRHGIFVFLHLFASCPYKEQTRLSCTTHISPSIFKVSLKTTNFIRTPLKCVGLVFNSMLTGAMEFRTQSSTQEKFDVSWFFSDGFEMSCPMKEQLLISIKTFMSFSENCRNTENDHLVDMFTKNMGLMVLQNYCGHVILGWCFENKFIWWIFTEYTFTTTSFYILKSHKMWRKKQQNFPVLEATDVS